MNRVIVILAAMLAMLAAPLYAAPGSFQQFPGMTSAYVGPRNVTVWLPDGYAASTARYAVLYMHDGRNLFDPATAMRGETWGVAEALAKLEATGSARRTIIVGIDNTALRSREYMPRKVFDALPAADRDRLAAGLGGMPLSDDYLKFIVTELKPMIDAKFRTDPRRDTTFIMGSSMGGLISLYAMLEYPQVFGGAACLSTHWPLPLFDAGGKPGLPMEPVVAAFTAYLELRLPAPGHARLWFDHGDQALDALYAPYQARIDALLITHGLRRDVDFVSRNYPSATHNEASWRARIDQPLGYLLAPR